MFILTGYRISENKRLWNCPPFGFPGNCLIMSFSSLPNALVSEKPRTPILGECGALAGDFSGFGLSLLPRYAGFSTALGASIDEWGPSAGHRRGFAF